MEHYYMQNDYILAYDTETTGLPVWQIPSGSPEQPHLVQLAGLLVNTKTEAIQDEINVIIKPDGWVIPEETVAIHGISMERAMDEGIPETDAIDQFLALRADHYRVAHNRTFDQRIVRIALKRYGYPQEVIDKWADKHDHYCTLMMTRKSMKTREGNLAQAYKHFTGDDFLGAHDAFNDSLACSRIYHIMLSNGDQIC